MRLTLPDESNECILCGPNSSTRVLCHRGTYRYLRCRTCSLVWIKPMPDHRHEESFERSYFVGGGARGGYSDYAGEFRWHLRNAHSRIGRLEAHVQGRGLLVDVGTALGYLPAAARDRGWSVVGVERSEWAAGEAKSLGLRVERSLEELEDLAGLVDAVTFFQVLEHMPDPLGALSAARRLLRPGGVLVCETWDCASRTARIAGAHWQQFNAPSVLWAFNPRSAGALVRTALLTPVSWRRSPKIVGLSTILGQTLPQKLGRHVDSSSWALSRIGVPYALDDLATFVARREE